MGTLDERGGIQQLFFIGIEGRQKLPGVFQTAQSGSGDDAVRNRHAGLLQPLHGAADSDLHDPAHAPGGHGIEKLAVGRFHTPQLHCLRMILPGGRKAFRERRLGGYQCGAMDKGSHTLLEKIRVELFPPNPKEFDMI